MNTNSGWMGRSGCRSATALACLLTIGACGGGSSSDAPGAAPAPDPTDLDGGAVARAPDESLSGTLWLERRGNKLVADAWFLASAAPGGGAPADGSPDTCTVDALSASPAQGPPRVDPARLRTPADRIVVASRGAEQLVLEPARIGAAASYADEVRWLRVPIEPDAQVSVLDAGGEALFDAVGIAALADPTLEAPADGRLASLGQSVRWSASDDPDTRVRLALSALVDGADRRIACTLVDDGSFEVPATLVAGAASPPGWTLSLAREKRVRTARGDDAFEIVQRVLF